MIRKWSNFYSLSIDMNFRVSNLTFNRLLYIRHLCYFGISPFEFKILIEIRIMILIERWDFFIDFIISNGIFMFHRSFWKNQWTIRSRLKIFSQLLTSIVQNIRFSYLILELDVIHSDDASDSARTKNKNETGWITVDVWIFYRFHVCSFASKGWVNYKFFSKNSHCKLGNMIIVAFLLINSIIDTKFNNGADLSKYLFPFRRKKYFYYKWIKTDVLLFGDAKTSYMEFWCSLKSYFEFISLICGKKNHWIRIWN